MYMQIYIQGKAVLLYKTSEKFKYIYIYICMYMYIELTMYFLCYKDSLSLRAGSPMTAKVRVSSIDDENRSLTMDILEGDVLKIYKSFKAKIQFNDVDNGKSKVIWALEYEKATENAPEPDHYVNFVVKMSKGLDAELRKAK